LQLLTKHLGEIEIDSDKVISFELGLPGFLEETKFVIIDLPENDLIKILQSTKSPNVAFFITNPHHFKIDYEFTLDESTIEILGIKSEKDVLIYSIMTIKEPFKASTINLQAPIIINFHKNLGKQFIINDSTYNMRYPISPLSKKGSE